MRNIYKKSKKSKKVKNSQRKKHRKNVYSVPNSDMLKNFMVNRESQGKNKSVSRKLIFEKEEQKDNSSAEKEE